MAWRVAKSLLKLREQVDAARPGRSKANDGTIGNEAHASRKSDHNPWIHDGAMGVVTAMDITHDPKHGVDTYAYADFLRLQRLPWVKYIISNRRISNPDVNGGEWRHYSGSNPHDEHVHISVKTAKSLYDLETPWPLGPIAVGAIVEDADTPTHPILKYDSVGPEVGTVQHLLEITPEFLPSTNAALNVMVGKTPWFGPNTEKYVKDFQTMNGLLNDGIVGVYTWRVLETLGTKNPTDPKINRNIVTTVFGGSSDRQKSAYTGKLLGDKAFYVALPYNFVGPRPKVKVTNHANGLIAVGTVEDIGPWNENDPYWTKPNGRPQSESGKDNRGRKTNKAGIDLSPAFARYLHIAGKGLVDWSFE